MIVLIRKKVVIFSLYWISMRNALSLPRYIDNQPGLRPKSYFLILGLPEASRANASTGIITKIGTLLSFDDSNIVDLDFSRASMLQDINTSTSGQGIQIS